MTDGLMNMLSTRKGDQYDFMKEELQNQLHKRLFRVNCPRAIPYIKSFENDDLSALSHGMNNLAHFYARTGDLKLINALLEEERETREKNSIFDFLDLQGRNGTYIAFISGHLDVVRRLVQAGYNCVAPVTEVLGIFINVLKSDDLGRFKHLVHHGFSQLAEFVTFDGKTICHLVKNFEKNDNFFNC